MTKKKTVVEVEAPVTESETPEVGEATPAKKRNRKGKPDQTLADVAAKFLAHLETERNASPGTCASYGLELRLAMSELGEETRLADLTRERVAEFFTCARVTRTRSGREKSVLSIAKTRRVWSQLLHHAGVPELLPEASTAA